MKRIMLLLGLSSFICLNQANAQCCDYTYQQQVEPPTSAATFGVALSDFDNDGDQDAVSISAYYGIDVYFNNGSGTFTLNAQYATGSNGDFYGVHACNVDGDNDIDIIAIPFYTSASLTILLNNGAGLFSTTTVSSNIAAYNAAIGDIDQDSDIDIFIANSGGGSGKVFKNNGFGSFSLWQTVTGARGHDVALGDLDDDGDLDAFSCENSSYGNSVFLNNGSGTFTQLGTTFGSNGSYLDLGDLDKDGDLDAWVGKFNNQSEIYLNNGTGVFTLFSTVTNGSYCKGVTLFDYDGDNLLDVFLGFYSSAPQIWRNNGNLNFSLCYQAPVGSSSHGQVLGYINNDNNIDIYHGYFSNDDGDYVFLNVSPSIDYTASPFCSNTVMPQNVTLTGTGGGNFSAMPSGLTIDSLTGAIIPASSVPGTYVIYYSIPGCSVKDTIRVKTINISTTTVGRTITANQDSATYQWIDCNSGYMVIPGLTTKSFTAPVTGGSFAVIVTYDGCTDTTLCVTIPNTIGFEEINGASWFEFHPNPVSDRLIIRTEEGALGSPFLLVDQVGRSLISGQIDGKEMQLDVSRLSTGIYILKVGSLTKRVLVRNSD